MNCQINMNNNLGYQTVTWVTRLWSCMSSKNNVLLGRLPVSKERLLLIGVFHSQPYSGNIVLKSLSSSFYLIEIWV